jgi:drug/metabolite transporter (DMT)-like permease
MRPRAYILAFAAILLWSTLASIAAYLRGHDPLVTTGIGLCIGGALSLGRMRAWRVPWPTLAVGCAGIFGYHILYFTAFAFAPALEVNVINYLWPLVMVLLSPLILGGRLRGHQVLGAALGVIGTVVLLAGVSWSLHYADALGYGLALGAAVIWASYSLLTRRLAPFPTAAVGGFCLASGLLALVSAHVLHGGLATQMRALSGADGALLVLAGIGPLGIAFYCWDAALKCGDPPTIAVLAYLTPVLSGLLLMATLHRAFTLPTAVALLLVVAGAALAARGSTKPADRPLA